MHARTIAWAVLEHHAIEDVQSSFPATERLRALLRAKKPDRSAEEIDQTVASLLAYAMGWALYRDFIEQASGSTLDESELTRVLMAIADLDEAAE